MEYWLGHFFKQAYPVSYHNQYTIHFRNDYCLYQITSPNKNIL